MCSMSVNRAENLENIDSAAATERQFLGSSYRGKSN